MSERKYYIMMDEHTVAEGMTLDDGLLFIKALAEKYYYEDTVYSIRKIDQCEGCEG